MMKSIAKLMLWLGLTVSAAAQSTSVTLNVSDADGQAWLNGTYSASLYSPPGVPGSPYFVLGSTLAVPSQNQSGSLSGSGSVVLTLTPNASIAPAGTKWQFVVCPNTSTAPCFTQAITIIGASQSVTISPPAMRVSAGPSPNIRAYTDAEVAGSYGSLYYNVISGTYRVCTLLVCTGSSGWSSMTGGTSSSTTTTSLSAGGLIGLWTFDEGSGQVTGNKVIPQLPPVLDFIGIGAANLQSCQFHTAGCVTATVTKDFAAGPFGDLAYRVQLANASQQIVAPRFFVPASQVTLSVWAMSNTGTSQKFRIGPFGGTLSSDFTATTQWQRFSFTFTGGGGDSYTAVASSDVAADASDILIWGAQLDPGPQPLGRFEHKFHMQLGKSIGAAEFSPTWITSGVNLNGNQWLMGGTYTPLRLTAVTISIVARWQTGQSTDPNYQFLIDSEDAALTGEPLSFNAAFANTRRMVGTLGTLGCCIADSITLSDDNSYHVYTYTTDGTNSWMYRDDALVAVGTAGSAGTAIIKNLYIGTTRLSNSGGLNYPGDIAYVALYNHAQTAAQVRANVTALQGVMAQRGITMTNTAKQVVFEGDSITAITSGITSSNYPILYASATTSRVAGRDFATSGNTIADLNSRATTVDSQIRPGAKNILSVLIGRNDCNAGDVAACQAWVTGSLFPYLDARRAAGWKVVLATLLPSTSAGFNAARNAANTIIYANWPAHADGLADIASDLTVGCDACAANVTYYSDGTHPTAAGAAILMPYFQTSIDRF